jgi:hypothetical protein
MAWAAREWEGFASAFAPDFRSQDRRSLVRLELDREDMLASFRPFFEMPKRRLTIETLATRGERVVLARYRIQGAEEARGPSEVEFLQVNEVDERGLRVVGIAFDPDDAEAAWAELDARYHAGEAAPYAHVAAHARAFARAFAARDWTGLEALCAPGLVVHDHRRLGWEALHGPEAYVGALRTLVELAPDTKMRLDHVSMCERGYLVLTVWVGSREGGAYEEPSLMVAELDGESRIRRFDGYEVERLAEARARYADLEADATRIPANAAWRIWEPIAAIVTRGDWPALRRLASADFAFEDRQRRSLVSGDVDLYVRNLEFVRAWPGRRVSRELLATAGDRLALDRIAFTGDPDGGAFEGEFLRLAELDDEGRLRAVVHFDAENRREAFAELQARQARAGKYP